MELLGPYPGLRPYKREESSIFFGREELCDDLLDKLAITRFLPIVGPSGCGKSSLVRAGMIADLIIGFMPGTEDHWKIAEMRPGDEPFLNLADALQQDTALGTNSVISPDSLRRGLSGTVDMIREVGFPKDTNLLILVDQFEEIFRYRADGNISDTQIAEIKIDESEAFVSLLLALSEQQVFPIYIVITMRTDFIGDCAKFKGLPEAINKGMFLVPRLTKPQLQRAIVEPARVFNCKVEDTLVEQLLNDVGTDPDDLPLMQHVLMRIYNQDEDKNLTYQEYLDAGGFKLALSEHANEAYNDLDENQRSIAEVIFRCLSTREKEHGRDTRRPTKLSEIADTCVTKPEIVEDKRKKPQKSMFNQAAKVVDVFRQPKYSFITPSIYKEKKLKKDTILDISHESLIRQWNKYQDWVQKETDKAATYQNLQNAASDYAQGKAGLLDDLQVQYYNKWWVENKPTAKWAERYNGDFNNTRNFFEKSLENYEDKKKAEKAAEEKEQQIKIEREQHKKKLAEERARIAELEKERIEKKSKNEKERIEREAEIKLNKERLEKIGLESEIAERRLRVIKGALSIAIGFVAIAIFFTYSFYREKKYMDNMTLGNEALAESKYEDAKKHYNNAIYWRERKPEAYKKKGIALSMNEQYDKAIESFRLGIDKKKNPYEFYNLIAETYQIKGNEKEAVKNFQRAYNLAPEGITENGIDTIVNSLIKKGGTENYKKAINISYKKVPIEKIKEVINALKNEGKNEEVDRYKRFLEKAIDAEPAEKYFQKMEYARDNIKAGKYEGAIKYLESAIDLKQKKGIPGVDVYVDLGYALLNTGKDEKAIDYFIKAAQEAPDLIDVDVYKTLGNELLKKGKTNKAIGFLKDAITISNDDDNVDVYLSLVNSLLQVEKDIEAVGYFREVISKAPDKIDAKYYESIGYALLKQDENGEAIKYFNTAISKTPEKVNAKLYETTGYALLKQGKKNEAIENFKKAISKAPDKVNANVYFIVANEHLNEKKYNEAITYYDSALIFKKNNPKQNTNFGINDFQSVIHQKLINHGKDEIYIKNFFEKFSDETKKILKIANQNGS